MIELTQKVKTKFFKAAEAEEKQQWIDGKLEKGYKVEWVIPCVNASGEPGQDITVRKILKKRIVIK